MVGAKCPSCALAVSQEANFCPACGAGLRGGERPERATDPWVEFLDRAWDFFASTRVAAWLLVVIAVASIAGTVIEQEGLYQDWRPPEMYYPARYGEFWGRFLMATGLTHAYSSVWYAALVLMMVLSLLVCSLQRLVPLHRSLTRPQVWKLPHFLRRQEVVVETGGDLEAVAETLRRAGYRIRRDRECLYADKGRISRYGPYVIHIGLLVVAFAAFARGIPGWELEHDVWIPDGQTVKVPETDFAVTSHQFTVEFYPSGLPSRYATDASITVGEEEVVRQVVEVNKPLRYKGWEVFQTSWRAEPGVAHLSVVDDEAGLSLGSVELDLRQPEPEYPIGETNLKLVVRSYLHDFVFDETMNEPTNASYEIRNPFLIAEFVTADTGERVGRSALLLFGQNQQFIEGRLHLEVDQIDPRWYTGLKLHKDRSIPYMYSGLLVVLVGMFITFFFFHWQVWAREEGGRVLVGARAYKNRFGLKREMERLFGAPHGEGMTADGTAV